MESGFSHTPVLPREVLEALRVRPGGNWVDGTCGGGGHSAAILEASSPGGQRLRGRRLDHLKVSAD